MTLEPGTIAFWRDFSPGHDKFVYILGVENEMVFSFTISSQLKYLSTPLKCELVEIPFRSTNFLNARSFIQCFHRVDRTPLAQFRNLEATGTIMWRGCLPAFIPFIAKVVEDSQVLPGYDRESVAKLLSRSDAG
ncbi:MAG: hypothetical protein ACRDHZ_19640 [Ktedonobacteraceae bacterium]